ncbi:Pimeloyl-ACP methyl ester carboxylesterase [Filimonas lacunae]|uniref:Pimeloyl-ACP methyl ester carboxylesterase n=1 Tax=Filimonas lacunae TaxID=477680 RepID=A0A173MMA3_9BACT|nr:alpha/beta hydrolase [Filimonas lacunae]BAV08508.1 beta-ketoadipate enol-lactone hydrolase [Filimonas lacunae]SIT34045.1 Pimeloyl-ACP methyl ester carboxylesterase [Filimonas lacunae]
MTKTYTPQQTTSQGHAIPVGNIEIYYEEYGVGKPLVLLHGFGGCTQNWHPFTTQLAEHYRLIVIDLRGHGRSTNPENKFTHREAANDVFLLLDKLGIDQFYAMGMSTGGMILLHMATNQPKRIEAMVLISATSHFPNQARIIMRRASFNTMPQQVVEMYRECAKRGDEQIQQLITQFNAFHDNYDDMNFKPQDLAAITARTLVIHGDRDNFFPVEIPISLHRSIQDSTLWIIPGGDHVPIFDTTIPFTTTALQFLDKADRK